ncbi:MAG: DNA gyrase subunit A [Dehalococcoidia bacterium]|nr:DNA gyrase subunit A [Dehalococcoidia bacterium]
MVTTPGNIQPVRIEEEMRSSYLSYAMSVIVSRALPDVRDGLKPVQRRILYSMHELGLRPGTAYKKSARIVGEVLGKYHPHGDSPVYEALVRMAQDFSMRYMLVDGQGNFGSIDDDPPAAMRYTEARLAAIAEELLTDIELNTVDFTVNFDGSMNEPSVLPGLLPNMLVNGASGIAVGMATNMPPHNLSEVCDAVVHLIDHPDAVVEELMNHIPGPDFPTRATIHGRSGIFDAYTTGQGRVIMQARADVEELRGGRKQIVVTEIPFQVNKAALVEKIAHLVRDKKIEGISDIRDESDRHGLRVVVELRREAEEEIVLNNLYKHTALRSSFNVIMLALVDGQPQVLDLRRALQLYIAHRQDVITRRSEHQLKVARDRAHIVEGLRMALGALEEVIAIIRASDDAAAARQNLMERLDLSEPQSQAILDMQLRRLAALEQERLEREYQDLLKTIGELEALLADPKKVLAVIRDDTHKLKKRFGDARRTEIFDEEPTDKLREEMIQHQEVVITLSKGGYIKRIPSATYKLQHRGGKGVRGMTTRDDDALRDLVVADTHDSLLLFTNRGRVYLKRGFDIQGDTSRTTRGIHLANLLPIAETERVNATVAVNDMAAESTLVLATAKGEIKALRLEQLKNIRQNGLNAMDLEDGDELVSVRLADDSHDVMIVTMSGQAIRFSLAELPRRSRGAGGIRGIRLAKGDLVVSMEVVKDDDMLLVVTSGGYGKLVHISRDGSKGFRRQQRGGMGTRTFRTGPKTGLVAAARVVGEAHGEEVMLVSAGAQVFRTSVQGISVQGRITQGVILWRPDGGDEVASVACF